MTKSVASILVSAAFAALSHATEWQWSVPDGENRAYLWIPPKSERVRAVIVCNHNMIEQGILEHPIMRKTIADLNMAEVWMVPYLDVPFDFNKGAGEHFERVMNALADESGYGELRVAPVVPLGHSACATYPWNFAAWNPERTLAILSVHGDAPQTDKTGYGRANVDWADRNIDGVPGLMVMGEYEWWEDRIRPAFKFLEKHPKTPMAFLGDAGHGHFDYSDELVSFLAMFIRKASEARLPKDESQQTKLRAIDPKDGWRIDRWRKDQPPAAPAAHFEEYAGNPKEAFWCFDEDMAKKTESYYAATRGKKPQLLSIMDEEKPEKGCGEPVTPRFNTGEDGVTFRLKTAFLDKVPADNAKATLWTTLPAGTPLEHATGGGSIKLRRIVGPIIQTGPDTFSYRMGRAEYTRNSRNYDMWIWASHPGDTEYKGVVQQAMIKATPTKDGAPQTITFPPIADQPFGTKTLKLKAASDAGVPVSYFVREGPVELEGDTLKFQPIPTRAKFPIKVTVVAWQFGRSAEPKLNTAQPVERTFYITK